MSIISGYLTQTAKWRKMVSQDGYPPQPGPPTEIKCRWEDRRRLVRNAQGQEVVSEARAWCRERIEPGDVLEFGGRSWSVLTVGMVPSLDGKGTFYEVFV